MATIKIHNVETNEVIEREMTDSELAVLEADRAQAQALAQAKLLAEQKRAEALAKLESLGLTESDLKALGL